MFQRAHTYSSSASGIQIRSDRSVCIRHKVGMLWCCDVSVLDAHGRDLQLVPAYMAETNREHYDMLTSSRHLRAKPKHCRPAASTLSSYRR